MKSDWLNTYDYSNINEKNDDDLFEQIYEECVSENIQNKIRAKKKKELKNKGKN